MSPLALVGLLRLIALPTGILLGFYGLFEPLRKKSLGLGGFLLAVAGVILNGALLLADLFSFLLGANL